MARGTRSGRARGLRADIGSATLELAVLAPALLALLGLVVAAGRITAAGSAVEQAASAAVRAASVARDARTAGADAERSARAALADQGIECLSLSSRLDSSGFRVAVGRPATVTVEVRCTVPLADLAVPGLPGSRVLSATTTSSLDTYRERS